MRDSSRSPSQEPEHDRVQPADEAFPAAPDPRPAAGRADEDRSERADRPAVAAEHRLGRDAAAGDRLVEPTRLAPLLPRRQNPWLLVEVDGSPASYGALVWALREAARREATVVALGVLDEPDDDPFGYATRAAGRAHAVAHDRIEAQLLRAIGETGVHGRSRCAVLSRSVLDALMAAGRGGDLVLVGAHGKSLLRHAIPRPPNRRLARGA